ncbi:immunoglobulin-like domain-containing protein [Terribacillus sp. 7520-G]|uniref:immunoglobulin-like domain-containing protein n=1 Tax=Terribacillus TaxID=459532 RepID=UPI000BA57A51|nr:immunoglobulin-like domain-containing protein [Terribacillus sp. 7520-G]PAD39880.1 hypothetical protein CHH53_02335 [Terribacillus sp. 7520-G]
MKRFILLFLLLVLFGCARELEPSRYGNGISGTNPSISLEIKDSTIAAPIEIPYVVMNESDLTLAEGRDFVIEKYDDAQQKWFQVPFKRDSAVQSDGWIIEPGTNSEGSIETDLLDHRFTEGDYRLIKELSSDGKGIVVYDEFTVGN